MIRYELDLEKLRGTTRIYVASSGAGAGIQRILWDLAGASTYLVGATFPYSKEASVEFLGYEPESFVCLDEAIDLAISSYIRADNGDSTKRPIGLGLTAAVASMREHQGDHRVYAVAITRDRVLASEHVLPKGVGSVFRGSDGNLTDTIGMELILAAAEVSAPDPVVKDITERARGQFLRRPLFTRYGTRLETPSTGRLTLFPGNFNPPHDGHFASAGEDVIFQITANPPHKPALSLPEMLGRVRHFRGRRDVLFMEDGALYLDKARRFPGSTFILGTDALERMLDPRWGIDVGPLLAEFRALDTTFKVGCRGSTTLGDIEIPSEFRAMFTELPRTPYADLSSTEIREALHGQHH